MNFVFISPHFPHTYWNFCNRLKMAGANVLGIGDAAYDSLQDELKNSLTEYYRVENMEDYDQMYRAVAYFAFKYGKIDWLESNNEYWLMQDAHLREDFNITTGASVKEVSGFRSKSAMKKFYAKGNVPAPRCHKVTTRKAAVKFLDEVGYPVIVKPDDGVGAAHTYKLEQEADLDAFFADHPDHPYLMEEFIEGDIRSYDAITDADCNPLFESMTCWPPSIADIVNKKLDLGYYVAADMPEKLAELGRATVKAFNARSRFVHLEFFCLTKPRKGLGDVGDFVALEVNMRPAGGYTPDMMNYAHSLDVYQIWADMATKNCRLVPAAEKEQCCAYASRRNCYEGQYIHSHEEIMEKYGSQIVMAEELPGIWEDAMGNRMYTAFAADDAAAKEFIQFVTAR